jgi:flavin-dependent dehydrogenase
MRAGKISSASVQWTRGKVGLRIGDAALAKDTLSSQGLASGISEALYAAALRKEEEQTLFSLRQIEQRQAHLNSLAHLIARCRFRQQEAWQQYAGFIAARINQGPQVEAALRVDHF